VGLQAVLAGVPADPSAERIADDADSGGGTVQRREAVLRRMPDHVLPTASRADARRAAILRDLDSGQFVRLEQDRVPEVTQ
jgi:hypothetical protein